MTAKADGCLLYVPSKQPEWGLIRDVATSCNPETVIRHLVGKSVQVDRKMRIPTLLYHKVESY